MSRSKKIVVKADESVNQQPVTVEVVNAAKPKGDAVFATKDKASLEKQESVIASNIGAFLVLGEALSIIKGGDLQKVSDPKLTFDEYCSKKWGFGKAYAYRLIGGYECVQHLKAQMTPNGVNLFPTNEAQVRPLVSLSPEEQVKAWAKVLKKANGGSITAAMVEKVVNRSVGKTTKSEATGSIEKAAAKADHKKLITIGKLVEEAKQVNPAELNLKKLLEILDKIEKLLKDEKS